MKLLIVAVILFLALIPKSTSADHVPQHCKLPYGSSYSVWVDPNLSRAGFSYYDVFEHGFHRWSDAFLHVHGINPFRMAQGQWDADVIVTDDNAMGWSYVYNRCWSGTEKCTVNLGPYAYGIKWTIAHEIGHCLSFLDHIQISYVPSYYPTGTGFCHDRGYWGVMDYCTMWSQSQLAFAMYSGWPNWKSDGDMIWCYYNWC